MGDQSVESSEKAESKKALKKEARKAEKAAKKAEHKGAPQQESTNTEEGNFLLFNYRN